MGATVRISGYGIFIWMWCNLKNRWNRAWRIIWKLVKVEFTLRISVRSRDCVGKINYNFEKSKYYCAQTPMIIMRTNLNKWLAYLKVVSIFLIIGGYNILLFSCTVYVVSDQGFWIVERTAEHHVIHKRHLNCSQRKVATEKNYYTGCFNVEKSRAILLFDIRHLIFHSIIIFILYEI